MKTIICLATFFISTLTFANTPLNCGATYAAGLGHLLKGESVQLGEKETIKAGQSVADEFYSFEMTETSKILKNKTSGEKIVLKSLQKNEGFEILTAKIEGQEYPEGVPGSDFNHQFIFVMCTEF
ncbi:MAG: hypothetical protein COW00_16125 [Bdellovibrio sp. CG12_big_fil_rev_8_21_14_0_65_39_13]|nr:MAG: hypothetical protein COW78_02505 [Bdellovibrio sp. CG22_combo_CG10-13_8_21_14_all_39_27]PIQ58370.1 MAG: hypothetical protein COW00_16125 [Bdellovibrio sp. CG12_big_fil_rev_8_21_14_0_65_39_13]PIR35883.1 MAG: hypothetical protein COV37_06710 [Bdellovibrio sp. CG11_big_fil_rev_8_21_14_0_20_39_38]